MDYYVIGLAAGLHAGKTYLARRLSRKYRGHIVSLADHFKVWALSTYQAMNEADKEEFQDLWGFTPSYANFFGIKTPASRHFLQQRGTEEGRNKYGDRIWLETLHIWMDRIHEQNGTDLFIVDDCRYRNEFEWLTQELHGQLIRIEAPDRTEIGLRASGQQASTHSSEQDMLTYPFEWTVDNRIGNESRAVARLFEIVKYHPFQGPPVERRIDDLSLRDA